MMDPVGESTGGSTRLISSLTVPHALRSALSDAGYKTTADILAIGLQDLCAELGISSPVAADLLRQCAEAPGPSRPIAQTADTAQSQATATQVRSTTAASLLSTSALPRFSTCIDALDDLLGSFCPSSSSNGYSDGSSGSNSQNKGKGKAMGITTGMSVEIAGPPGIGKTTLALGMVLDARLQVCEKSRRRDARQMDRDRKARERTKSAGHSRSRSRPPSREGCLDERNKAEDPDKAEMLLQPEGEVLIIDTEGGLPPDKLFRMAEIITRDAQGITPSDILDGIHLVRIATQVQMVAFLNLLDEWLVEHPHVNLIIMDSLSYHFRQPSLDIGTRRRIMDTVKQQIGKATAVHQCAVVVTSQMATKLLSAEGKRVNFDTGEKAVLMPQLGEAWQTAKTVRVALFRGQAGDEYRYAHVDSTEEVEGRAWAKFDIDGDGLPVDVGTFG